MYYKFKDSTKTLLNDNHRVANMTLHSITTSPTLTTPETEKVKKLRSKDENRRIWLVEKNGHRSIETMHDLDKPDPYVKFLKRKGFYINEIPINS